MGLFYSRGRKCPIWASGGDFSHPRAARGSNPLNPCETAFKRLLKAPIRGDPGRLDARGSGTGATHLQATRPTWRIGKEKQAHELSCACCGGLAKWDPICSGFLGLIAGREFLAYALRQVAQGSPCISGPMRRRAASCTGRYEQVWSRGRQDPGPSIWTDRGSFDQIDDDAIIGATRRRGSGGYHVMVSQACVAALTNGAIAASIA